MPLLKRRMHTLAKSESANIPPYIEQMFNHFCDWKRSVNLSCIELEAEFMDESLREILFKVEEDGFEELNINIRALTDIFPHLKSYVDGDAVNPSHNRITTFC